MPGRHLVLPPVHVPQRRLEMFALEQFHHDAQRAVRGPTLVEDAHRRSARKRAQRASFAKHPLPPLNVLGELITQHLDRDPIPSLVVACAVDVPLAAARNHLAQLVAAADQFAGAVGWGYEWGRHVTDTSALLPPIEVERRVAYEARGMSFLPPIQYS